MLARKELAMWLEGTGIVLPPPPTFGERMKELLELRSERKFQRVFLLLHLVTVIILIGGLLWKMYLV
ncbi:MAG: hypothetical protein V4585_17280 [Bacteroidota bacterium]